MSTFSHWSMTKEQVPHFLRGLDRVRWNASSTIFPPRLPEVDILGAGFHTGVGSHGVDFQSWLTEFIPDLAVREKLCIELDILQALNPRDPISIDLSSQDSLDFPLWQYLLKLPDSRFLGRVFDLETQRFPLFTTSVEMGFVSAYARQGRHQYGLHSTLFRAIEIKPDLPPENELTKASHIAAVLNCPLMEVFGDSPAAYLKQDQTSYYGILDGLTALHHAARALSKKALMRLLEILGSEAFTAFDKNGNTFLHALACSQNSGEGAAHQIDLLKTFVKFFFATERDLSNREKFYQHLNKFGDTALNIAANRGNKELVTELVFLPGAKTEAKSSTNPKGIDFGALGIDYGTLLARKHALFGEYMMTLEESVFSLREEGELQREAMRAMADALDASERRQSLLEDELIRSREERFMLMQMMGRLCQNLESNHLIAPGAMAAIAAPFLALGDFAGAGAGAGLTDDLVEGP